jgi:FMN phosphatase YigB (HAD superfamily)
VAAHELGIGKPDPRIFRHACDLAGVLPSQVLHIGDDLDLDVRGAREAGLHAAWLRRPDLQEQLRHAGKSASGPAADNERLYGDLEAIDRALTARAG